MQLGKSASHSRITETISLQETGGMYRKADRQTHTYAHTHTHTHTDIHTQASGRFPEEGGEKKRGGWGVAYTATDLTRSFPQGDSVIGSSHRLVCMCACVCVWVRARVCVCEREGACVRAHLTFNDEHHPDRDLGETKLSVNWNCHIQSQSLKWRLPLVLTTEIIWHWAVYFGDVGKKKTKASFFKYRIHFSLFLWVWQVLYTYMRERTALALPGEVCWCCNLFPSTSTASLFPRTTLSVSDVDRHSIQNCLLFFFFFFSQTTGFSVIFILI